MQSMHPVLTSFVAILLVSGCEGVERAPDPEPGIPRALAERRAAALSQLHYDVALTIPADPAAAVTGRAAIEFELGDASEPLVLDFAPGADHLIAVAANGRPSAVRAVNGHLVIPADELAPGQNRLEIEFRAGDASLNRSPEFVYTLFVPARAHLAIPCFDQPDLKARFSLELTVPADWQAIGNGAELTREATGDGVRIRYAPTEPIPTYLFAFAAGKFEIESAQRGGRTYRMFHRETDAAKLARNRDEVFDLHASSLDWLETYTAIRYPFGKFDFVLIPSFQFNGMEHPGAIFYNAASILLDESATENQRLGRASVIAHETAHMWFGDLVTMRWFDDVWMKEVFASFMAAKIVNPAFPNVNHDLRFLVAHYPAAYAVDRTAGTHPIRQPLDNLDEAGSLYGAIIYQKAPIVMRQLERLLGEVSFRDGLREYLDAHAFGNATWQELVTLLDARTDIDLAAWSRVWVEEAGRPAIRTQIERDPEGAVERLSFVQSDPEPGRELRWTQQIEVLLGTPDGVRLVPLAFAGESLAVPARALPRDVELVLPAGGGLAYGAFTLDDASRAYLLARLPALRDPVARGAVWVTLWDELLDGRLAPAAFVELALRALPREDTEQVVQLVLGYVTEAFWRFLSADERAASAAATEAVLRAELVRTASASMKATYFTAFRALVTTRDGVDFLERIWRRETMIEGLTLAETDEAEIALELAVREVAGAAGILEAQRARFMNPDRKARFEFVMPALSADETVRDAFFASLADVANRRREPWVIEGLRYLNHPLRAAAAEKHLRPALELLPELQRTGDVFFPRNWTAALLNGHRSPRAADIVRAFLDAHPDLSIRLRRIVLQSADGLYRAAERTNDPAAADGAARAAGV
jgi:aminopeptidase N